MKTSAILLAIRLYKHPHEMQWLCQADAALPKDITDLLRLYSSQKLLEDFIKKNQIKTDIFIKVLDNFIEKVLFNPDNSVEKQLGLTKVASAETAKLHYKLLIKIFHPDRNSSTTAAENTSRITQNYQALKQKKKAQDTVKNSEKSSRNRTPPNSFYRATHKAERQISRIKNTFIGLSSFALLALVMVTYHLYQADKPQLIAKEKSRISAPLSNQKPKQKPDQEFNETPSNSITLATFTSNTEDSIPQHQLEQLLHDLEVAYEQGNVKIIKPILENAPEIRNQTDEEINAKLDTLFQITKDRKMLLFDFSWKTISGQYKGQGKFLSRYMLAGQEQWLTREGKAYITINSNNSQPLKITNFKLENNSNEY